MPGEKKSLRTCPRGHQYAKSSDCLICPVCEGERKPGNGFLSLLPAPARRALEIEAITSLEILSAHSETEILSLHEMEASSIPKLRLALEMEGLKFRD
jgi:hypothetical protein